jgi:hypothetical protein
MHSLSREKWNEFMYEIFDKLKEPVQMPQSTSTQHNNKGKKFP